MNCENIRNYNKIYKYKREISKLSHEIIQLKAENEKLKKEFNEYKFRHPQTTGEKGGKVYAIKKESKKGTTKDTKDPENNETGEKKKRGAQPGHKGNFRAKPEKLDIHKTIDVTECPYCGNTKLSRVQEERTRIVEDIPIVMPIVTMYHILRRYCPKCGKMVEGEVLDALPNARIGLRAMLTAVWMDVVMRDTAAGIPKIFKNFTGLKISTGEIKKMGELIAKEFSEYYKILEEMVREADVRYMDETSWRESGINKWLWVFVAEGVALYKIAKTRSHQEPLSVLGENPKGTDVHDRFSAYNKLARKTGNRPQQICWFHLLVDSKDLAELYGEEGKKIHETMKYIHKKAKLFNGKGRPEDVENLISELLEKLDKPYKNLKCRKFRESLERSKDRLFQFVINPKVESTNNKAERAVRPMTVKRKISGGTRSPKGSHVLEVLASVLFTSQNNGADSIEDLLYLIRPSQH